ncbi:MAG: mycofactocin-associated electron transfer flavoprotein beta subunit [Acidimicrobiales bacterium]|nr:mycofactocin-associated electron transfer flavoprotein beta subunit [Acidimicrobiales bacterium]
MADRPLIAVCLSPADLRPEVDRLTGRVRADARRAALPANEAAALEHGLRIAEVWGGTVLAVTAGPPEADRVLADAVALGARALRALRVGSTPPEGAGGVLAGFHDLQPADLAGDPGAAAAALAAAIRSVGNPDMVVCGDGSAWQGIGAVPAFLAHHLGVAQALGVVGIQVEANPNRLLVERRLDGGWREALEVHPPAVVSVEAAGVRLRRAGMARALSAAALASGTSHVPVAEGVEGAGPGDVRFGSPRPYRPRTQPVVAPSGDPRQRLLTLTGALARREPARVTGPVSPGQAAAELLAFLERTGFAPTDRLNDQLNVERQASNRLLDG